MKNHQPLLERGEVFGLVKTSLDAHTLGVSVIQQLLEACGVRVVVADNAIATAIEGGTQDEKAGVIRAWILANDITRLGFSYRLDPGQAIACFARLVYQIDSDPRLAAHRGGTLRAIAFAGLPEACERVERLFPGRFCLFRGDETPREALERLGVPSMLVPASLTEESAYAESLLSFGKTLLASERHQTIRPFPPPSYVDAGTSRDHLEKRLAYAARKGQLPLMRAHVGPYLPAREEALAMMNAWLRKLATAGFLDIASLGTSQLTQSHFGEDWTGMSNGGGVPINSEAEFRAAWQAARPMLVRAYSATDNVPAMARILERTLHNAWHAVSLWWFSELDGRGPQPVLQNLHAHMEALRYAAACDRPAETNVPHHFAFRGADDVAYLVSGYLGARVAKACGIRTYVLQNMLSVPKCTFGLQDVIKARALLRLVGTLADQDFQILYQPRAGLDFFSPDLEKAKVQLAAVTALMSDVDPAEGVNPPIIHVVSYSEGAHLADPQTINESVQIARAALEHFPSFRRSEGLQEALSGGEIDERVEALWVDATRMIGHIEAHIGDICTPRGLYRVLQSGYIPLPYLWSARGDFPAAIRWKTRAGSRGVEVVDEGGAVIGVQKRLALIETTRT